VRGVLNTSEVLGAISRDRIALQIGIEGAFPLEVQEDDVAAYRALLANPDNQLPSDFPLPTETEIATTEGRLAYMQRIGVSYMGLNHLDSSCWSGSDLFTASARHSGLTDRGRELVRLFDRTGMILDMAHASQNAQLDAAGMVERGEYSLPLLVSHSVHQLGR
jgi:microsomal dipeptidase-like Zn-dependent dipeptidase